MRKKMDVNAASSALTIQNAVVSRYGSTKVGAPKFSVMDWLVRWAVLSAMVLSFLGAVFADAEETAIFLPVVVGVVIVLGAVWMALGVRVRGALLLVLLVVAVVWREVLVSGMAGIGNAFLRTLTEVTGQVHQEFAESVDSVWGQTLAGAWIAAILTALFGILVTAKRTVFLFLPIVLLAVGVISGFLTVNVWMWLCVLSLMFVFLRVRFVEHGQGNIAGHVRENTGAWVRAMAISTALVLLIAVPGYALLGRVSETELTERGERWMDGWSYGGAGTAMPRGWLSDLPARNPSGQTALVISGIGSEKMYLKGFVGEVYTGTRWTVMDGADLAEQAELFYWLHRGNFYGQRQIAQGLSVTSPLDTALYDSIMMVRRVSAYAKWAFVPYGLADTEILDSRWIGDARIRSREAELRVRYIAGSVPMWYALQGDLARAQAAGDDSVHLYLTHERAYAEFVRNHYLQMTDESVLALDEILAQSGDEDPKTTMTLTEITTSIRAFLDENMRYEPQTLTHSGKQDFAAYVLRYAGSGYSVHYATLATLLLRYYGVPARYVEGYYLPTETRDPAEEQAVNEHYAHAWSEYYLDGVGWIPFETTPGYIDREEILLSNNILDENSELLQQMGSSLSREYERPQRPKPNVIQPENTTENPRENDAPRYWHILPLLAAIALLITAIVWITVRRRRFVAARKRMLHEPDDKKGTTLFFSYALHLMHHAGFTAANKGSTELYDGITEWLGIDIGKSKPELAEIFALHNKAMFSGRPVTKEERGLMQSFASDILDVCKNRWGTGHKLYYKFWNCIY